MHLLLYGEEPETLEPPSPLQMQALRPQLSQAARLIQKDGWRLLPLNNNPFPPHQRTPLRGTRWGLQALSPRKKLHLLHPRNYLLPSSPSFFYWALHLSPTGKCRGTAAILWRELHFHSTTAMISEMAVKNNTPVKSCQSSCTTRKSNTYSEIQTQWEGWEATKRQLLVLSNIHLNFCKFELQDFS